MITEHGIAYEVRGTGLPVLFLHGIGHDRQAWDPIVAKVSSSRSMILVDLPGHGSSPLPSPADGLGVERLAELVRGFQAELGILDAAVVGNSLGGAIALELTRAGSARACLAISPIGFWSPGEIRYAVAVLRGSRAGVRALKPALPRLLASSAVRRAVLAPYFGRPQALTPEQATRAARGFAEAPGVNAILPYSSKYRFRPDETLNRPQVTIAWGDKDRLLPKRQADRARQLLPGAQIVSLPGAGHVPMFDDPQAVADLVLHL
jgi:pimeloyl-ACP methyl ester carboxylesterase